jgi:hypothetical protein
MRMEEFFLAFNADFVEQDVPGIAKQLIVVHEREGRQRSGLQEEGKGRKLPARGPASGFCRCRTSFLFSRSWAQPRLSC